MADMSHYAILYTFKPLNFSGEITVITRLEGNTYNYGVQRYRSLNPIIIMCYKLERISNTHLY